MNIFREILLLSAAFAGLAATGASAAIPDVSRQPERPAQPTGIFDPLLLAQNRDVLVYFDGRGRRVLVDRWTGEILAIQRPRVSDGRRIVRERLRERLRERNRYYLDDPDDIAGQPRRRLYEREFPLDGERRYLYDLEDGDVAEAPEEEYQPRARNWSEDDEVPEMAGRPRRSERRVIVRPGPVERRALPEVVEPGEEPDVVIVPDGESRDLAELDAPDASAELQPDEPADPGSVIVDPAVPPSVDPIVPFGARNEVAELQVLLDRAGVSPGVIDGKFGGNVDKALAAYASVTGSVLRSTDAELIRTTLEAGGPAFVDYTITPEDAAGPYVASVPADYGEKAKLERLSYTSVSEMLAERFHMDETFLKALNPDANFNRPGTVIRVASIGQNVSTPVTRIIADKTKKQVRAYGADGSLVAAYPATIGSADTPSPSGPHAVARIAFDPEYTYNPKVNFQQGDNKGVLTIPPGPNGPVGSIWIALDRPTYGIHGTPDPSKIGRAESHGCVRLTNWDAQELAKLVQPGVVVDFIE